MNVQQQTYNFINISYLPEKKDKDLFKINYQKNRLSPHKCAEFNKFSIHSCFQKFRVWKEGEEGYDRSPGKLFTQVQKSQLLINM